MTLLTMLMKMSEGLGKTCAIFFLTILFSLPLGMLITLVLGIRNGSDMYFEAALIIALTGFVSSSALAKFLLRGEVIE